MIDFACVSSTTPTWSNDPRWCIPGIAATEPEHAKLAADRASSAPVQGVHRYYPFVVEDRGRLGKSASTVVYIFAVLLDVRNFPGALSATATNAAAAAKKTSAPTPTHLAPPTTTDYVDTELWGPFIASGLVRHGPKHLQPPQASALTCDTDRSTPRYPEARGNARRVPLHRLPSSLPTPLSLTRRGIQLYWRRFKTLPRTHLRAKPLSAPCVSAVALTARSTRRTVSGYHSNIGHTKGGGETSDMTDRVFAEPALDRFLKLKAAFASSKYDTLHRAFVDKTLKVSLMASAKAATAAAFAKRSPDKQPDPNLKPDPRLKPTPQAKA
eukprot:jgi/Tetstr1/426838/TSEL_017053.t1